ncbi:MAG TPA: gas vesicle protein GvpG [Chroococcidiopsis sp.]
MFLDLLIAPLTAPITGVTWIAGKLLEQAEGELDEKENLQKRLLALQLAFDMGDVPEDEFEEQEEELLLAIQAMEDEERANNVA